MGRGSQRGGPADSGQVEEKRARKQVAHRKGAIVKIQGKARQRQARKKVAHRKGAVVRIQGRARQRAAKKRVASKRLERKQANQQAQLIAGDGGDESMDYGDDSFEQSRPNTAASDGYGDDFDEHDEDEEEY